MSVETVPAAFRMMDVVRLEEAIDFTFSSSILLVDQIVPLACDYLREHEQVDLVQFNSVLRELLLNAIEHGNHGDSQKTVHCKVTRMRGSLVEVMVEDEGEGFPHRDLHFSMPENLEQPRNRGLALVHAFSEEVHFSEKGNSVIAFVFVGKSAFEVREEDKWQFICVNEDLTASIANKFRLLLLDLVNAGHTQFRFDLQKVNDMDSIALNVLFVLSKMLANQKEKSRLEIIHANASLRLLFRMTHLDSLYSIRKNY